MFPRMDTCTCIRRIRSPLTHRESILTKSVLVTSTNFSRSQCIWMRPAGSTFSLSKCIAQSCAVVHHSHLSTERTENLSHSNENCQFMLQFHVNFETQQFCALRSQQIAHVKEAAAGGVYGETITQRFPLGHKEGGRWPQQRLSIGGRKAEMPGLLCLLYTLNIRGRWECWVDAEDKCEWEKLDWVQMQRKLKLWNQIYFSYILYSSLKSWK